MPVDPWPARPLCCKRHLDPGRHPFVMPLGRHRAIARLRATSAAFTAPDSATSVLFSVSVEERVAQEGSRAPRGIAPSADWTTLSTTASALGTCAGRRVWVQLRVATGG